MREIKYKLWHKPTKTMYYYEPMWGNYYHGDGWIGVIELKEFEKHGKRYQPSNRIQLEPEECEWLQFTGLFDKNWEGIYEGDIVKRIDDTLRLVQWSKFGFQLYSLEMKDRYWNSDYLDWECSEVIGNIYENPELLQTTCSQDSKTIKQSNISTADAVPIEEKE